MKVILKGRPATVALSEIPYGELCQLLEDKSTVYMRLQTSQKEVNIKKSIRFADGNYSKLLDMSNGIIKCAPYACQVVKVVGELVARIEE